MRILLTGSTGMVGRNFLQYSTKGDYKVIAPTRAELNLLQFESVKNYLQKHKPDFILHAAGRVGGIQANIAHPVNYLVENLDMGRNILCAAQEQGVKRLINLGSSCMYPRNADNPLKEESILQGQLEPTNEGYALAKIVTARLCEYISRENSEFQYKTLIPCNLYGKWDKFDPKSAHMIPSVIRKIHLAKKNGDKEVEIWGDGKARREFLYVGDLAECLDLAIKKFDDLPTLMNVGLGYDFTINEYYQVIADVIGYKGDFVHDQTKPTGMKRKVVHIDNQVQWGWKAKTSLINGIKETYQFFLQNGGDSE
ncbi:MAG TPA: GDP-L-fucose synthase [Bacillota bacterium]|nr:GDP-L-fucose synthase [Bacillota bacterium]